MINSQNISIQNSGDTRDNPPQHTSPLQQQQNFISTQQNVMMAQPILYDGNSNNPNPNYFQFLYGHDKWPQNVERAFTAALKLIVKSGTSKTKIRNKNYGRNELISLYIRYHTGEIRTKKQISSHIQVWKKSILSKMSSDVNLTPLDTEVLSLIENGAEQNEKSLSLFYSVFDEIIDAMTKDKNYQKFKNTITDTTRSNNNGSPTINNSVNTNSPPNSLNNNALLYQQRQPQQLVQVQGQPMMVQEQNMNGPPTYSIIQSVPMIFVQDNQQPNILRPVTYNDGSRQMMTRGPQQRPEWGYNTNNNNNNNNNPNNASQNNNNNNNNYSGNFNSGSKGSMPYQYEQPSYYYSEKTWQMPANNILSSSSSSSSSGSTVSYPQWGAASLSIQNSENTPSTTSTRTQEVLPSSGNILSSLGSSNDGISQSTSHTNNSDNILNSIAAATTHSTSISQNDNERPRLPPVSQNQFFRANDSMLKSAVLPPLQYSSSNMSSSRHNTNSNNNDSNNNNSSDNRSGYPKSMSSLGSTSTELRMNSGNNINKKSQMSPRNIPSSLNRQFSSNQNNVTILPSISAYRRPENDTGNNINGTNTRI